MEDVTKLEMIFQLHLFAPQRDVENDAKYLQTYSYFEKRDQIITSNVIFQECTSKYSISRLTA